MDGKEVDLTPCYVFKGASEDEIETIASLDIENKLTESVVAFSTKSGTVRVITVNVEGQERFIEFENELSEHETHSKIFKEIITNMKLTSEDDNIELWVLGADSNLKKYVF